jgi:hypothetical protein
MATDRVRIDASEVLFHAPAEWTDHTGPFGGAYQWALDNLKPNTEVLGAHVATNSHGRKELYKFRLIHGPDSDIRGKMELENNQSLVFKNGYMGLAQGHGQEWIKRWILVDIPEGRSWELEWERTISYREPNYYAPAMAISVLTHCAEQINSYARASTKRNWCREVLGVNHTQLDQCRFPDLVRGPSTDRHRALHRVVANHLQGVQSRVAQARTRRAEQFTTADMNYLVEQGQAILGITR